MGRILITAVLASWLAAADGVPAGEITGHVMVKAETATRRPKRYYMGPHRSGGTDHPQRASSATANVVVYLEGVEAPPEMTPTPPPPVMRQKDEMFWPHVLPILVGTAVTFPNEDDFYHNVFSVVAGDRFDLGRYAAGEKASDPFEKTGIVVVRCEIHPGMKAYILVLPTSAFLVPADDGSFRFGGLKAGGYTLRAWHPTAGEWSRPVEVPAGGAVDVDIAF